MKPYEFISHIIDDTIASALAHDRYMILYFRDHIRFNHALWKSEPGSTPHEWLNHKFMSGNYRYHSEWKKQDKLFGGKAKDYGDINFIDHSWEPVFEILDKPFWQSVKEHKLPHCLIHSENSSEDIKNLQLPNAHWFSHAYLCSEFYFHHYQKLKMVYDYKSRPINYPWICANRLIRKHRTSFLELINLNDGVYSFMNPDPNGLVYTGPVLPNSFDDHTNSSAEIKVDDLTPWNTSFLHIVSETVWQDKIHFTEKVFKPIVLHQPFVVLQAPGSLEYLRSYGFKTFGDWWDESYDTIQDPNERMQAIADIVNWIPTQNLHRMRTEMSGVLEHNFRHFYENIPDIVLDELRVNLKNAV